MYMKKISVVIPCYNEEENVGPICNAVVELFEGVLCRYDYEIVFAENCSVDNTRAAIKQLCQKNPRVKAIFNAQNFGQFNSPYHAMMQTTGDCTILMAADFQDPPAMIPRFVEEWENGGYQVVCGIKTSSKESSLMYFLRGCYYKTIKKMSSKEQIQQFTGFGLYDKRFIQTMQKLDDPVPFLRGIVAEYASNRKELEYEQPQRRAGKTSNNWKTLYDAAMLSFTSYTKTLLRLPAILGAIVACLSFAGLIAYLIVAIIMNCVSMADITLPVVGMFAGVQLFFIGMIGEYILVMNERLKNRPLVVEETRLNFTVEKELTKV